MPASWWSTLWQCTIHWPGLSASRSTASCCIGRTITVSLRGPGRPPCWTWKVWPCRCIGWNIIDWLPNTSRTRSPVRTGSGSAWSKVRPLIVHCGLIIPPDSSSWWVRSGRAAGSIPCGSGPSAARAASRPSSSPGPASVAGGAPGAVRTMPTAWPCLPSARATSGKAPSPKVTSASQRSPIPTSTVSTVVGATGKPSVWVTVSRWPPRARRKAVSAAALITRSRSRCPGLARIVGGWVAVEQVQRVVDHAAGSAELRAAALPQHAHPAVHVHHAALAHEPGVELLGGRADPKGPVVQHHDRLLVIAAGLGGVVDQQRGVQPAVQLQADVGVEEVGAGVGHGELVGEAAAGLHRRLGHVRDAVHVVAQPDAVPVDGGGLGQPVVELNPE